MVDILVETKSKAGRIFFLGVGGSAANASHAVNDFRKICGMEAYAPTDNVSELTARTNDDGWESVFEEWLKGSCLRAGDCVFVFSVGGGNLEKNVSANLVRALIYAKSIKAKILGVVLNDLPQKKTPGYYYSGYYGYGYFRYKYYNKYYGRDKDDDPPVASPNEKESVS